MLDKNIFRSQMMMLESIYSCKVFTSNDAPVVKQALIEMWYSKVKHLPENVFKAGVNRLTDTHQYRELVPAHLVKACKDVLKENMPGVDEAYKEIEDSYRKYYHGTKEGCQQAMDSYSPVVRRIVERHGGFYEISMKEGIDREIFEREFKKEIDQEVSKEVQSFVTNGTCLLDFSSIKLLEG